MFVGAFSPQANARIPCTAAESERDIPHRPGALRAFEQRSAAPFEDAPTMGP